MTRALCIHGHFYQPPRENPWLEAIEVQDSAYPYHDWNERINQECYAANAASRRLGADGVITAIVSNYEKISFNFGPTLLAWMEAKAPATYAAVVVADRRSAERFSGHGSAIAQPYNHMIMPLANARDRATQAVWGIADFEHRFGRAPEGMWLPETAVDVASLEVLAGLGIRYTILAPSQAARVRALGEEGWQDVSGARVDPGMPYAVRLPSGRSIAVFFYDGPVSRAIAFEGLLGSGERLAERLVGAFDGRDGDQLVHIATDGETYGHHHRYGDMALAYALEHIEAEGLARLTNYGEYLDEHPPTHEAEIVEETAWSCVHGLGRWSRDCGCATGANPGWSQAWREPLRAALDWLRDELAPRYEREAATLLADPWAARDGYISVILDRRPASVDAFLDRHATGALPRAEQISALKLLELQRHAMLMYTSCGWFFDELSGIETVQVIAYAGRAVQLAEELFGESFEDDFGARLERARSNVPKVGDGRRIYRSRVKPSAIDLAKVGAHYAMTSLFEDDVAERDVYCYRALREDRRELEAGVARLVVGRARITSSVTRESARLDFGVLHLGDHNLSGGIRDHEGDDIYRRMVDDVTHVFATGEYAAALRWLDAYFGNRQYTLRSLFRDEQRRVVDLILEGTLREAEVAYRQLYERHAPLMRYLAEIGAPLPRDLRSAAEVVLNVDLRRAFAAGVPDPAQVRALFEGTAMWRLELDTAGLAFALEQTLERMSRDLSTRNGGVAALERLEAMVDLAVSLPFAVDLWPVQNRVYELLAAEFANGSGGERLARLRALGEKLRVRP